MRRTLRSTLRRTLSFMLALALVLTLTGPAAAGELKGVTLPDTQTLGGETLQLNGMALRKVAFFKVYVAGLYLPEESSDGEAVLGADTPRHMEMHWLRNAGEDKVCEGWTDGLAANTPDATPELQGDFQRLCEWTGGADDGDVYKFTYLPGTGTEVTVRGEVKGTIEGKDFADALWAVWIGPEPGPGQGFKKDLLGG